MDPVSAFSIASAVVQLAAVAVDACRGLEALVWNEQVFKDHRDRLSLQIQSLNLLVSVAMIPSSTDQISVLSWLRPVFRKAESSAWTIVNTHGASSLRIPYPSTDSFRTLESAELLYHRLDCENDLYLAPVYKRVIHSGLQNKIWARKQADNSQEKRHDLNLTQLPRGDTVSVLPIDAGPASSQTTVPAHSTVEQSPLVSDDSPGRPLVQPPDINLDMASQDIDDGASDSMDSHESIWNPRAESVLLPPQEISAHDLENLPPGPPSTSVQDDLADSLHLEGARLRSLPPLSRMRKENIDSSRLDALKSEILRAVAAADALSVASALDEGADINCADESGKTLLHIVLERPWDESETIFDLLTLYQELDIFAKDNEGNTSLHVAAQSCPQAINKLLTSGAPIPQHPRSWFLNHAGHTPLFVAVRVAHERPEALDSMLKYPRFEYAIETHVNDISNPLGDTALGLAFQLRQQDTIAKFIEIGMGMGKEGLTQRYRVLDSAVEARMTYLVTLILKRIISVDHDYDTLERTLKYAIEKQAPETAEIVWKVYQECVMDGTIKPKDREGPSCPFCIITSYRLVAAK